MKGSMKETDINIEVENDMVVLSIDMPSGERLQFEMDSELAAQLGQSAITASKWARRAQAEGRAA